MGNCFSGCTKSKDCDSSSERKKSGGGKQRAKRTKRNLNAGKTSANNSSSLTPKDHACNNVADVATKKECLVEGCQSNGSSKASNANARIIDVRPSLTSENSSKETFPGEGVKRPITGSESNASLTPSTAVEETRCDDDLEELELGQDEKTRSTPLEPRGIVSPEIPERRGHFQLLEFLKIRFDMAANNMEINRLLTNVDRALDRTSRARELGFRRMREAKEAQRAARDMCKAEESRRANQNVQEETSNDEDEPEFKEAVEGDDGDNTPTPPPPIPRICWQ